MKNILFLLVLFLISCVDAKPKMITSRVKQTEYVIDRYKQRDLVITKSIYDSLKTMNPRDVCERTLYYFILEGDGSNPIYVDEYTFNNNSEGDMYKE